MEKQPFPTRRLNVTIAANVYQALKRAVASKPKTYDADIVEEALKKHPLVREHMDGATK
jgi:hypothetical protein